MSRVLKKLYRALIISSCIFGDHIWKDSKFLEIKTCRVCGLKIKKDSFTKKWKVLNPSNQ